MSAFYNEIDPYAAQWLRNLIAAGHIAPGVVDERSIVDLDPAELAGYTQCHFFAGIGVWSHALRLAGWPDDRPVWTGSCPCQPFSAAGKGKGHEDERHLWPAWFRLIGERRPAVVFGEQVASADGLAWLDPLCTDMEGAGYAIAAANLPAAGVGAPHVRARLFFVADSGSGGLRGRHEHGKDARAPGEVSGEARQQRVRPDDRANGAAGLMADTDTPGQREQRIGGLLDGERPAQWNDADGCGAIRELADTAAIGSPAGARLARLDNGAVEPQRQGDVGLMGHPERDGLRISGRAATDVAHESSYWALCDWIDCRAGRRRPVEPGTFPLAHGATTRVGRLRAYGNAIVPQAAAAVIGAYMEGAA